MAGRLDNGDRAVAEDIMVRADGFAGQPFEGRELAFGFGAVTASCREHRAIFSLIYQPCGRRVDVACLTDMIEMAVRDGDHFHVGHAEAHFDELVGNCLFQRDGEDALGLLARTDKLSRQAEIPEEIAVWMAHQPARVGEGVGLASIVALDREDIEVGDIDRAAIELDELERVDCLSRHVGRVCLCRVAGIHAVFCRRWRRHFGWWFFAG